MSFLVRLLILMMGFISCQNPNTNSKVNQSLNKEVKKTEIPPKKSISTENRIPRLTNKNVLEFYNNYGPLHPENKIRIKTSKGNIDIKLYEDTPIHRANFIHIVKRGFLSETCFYRVAKGFVIQGGNSDSFKMSRIKSRIGKFTLPSEFLNHRKHTYGTVAMARVWKNNPNKRSSPFEFYIVVDPKGSPHLNNEHTVIGKVIAGMDVAEKISNVEVDRSEWPKIDICLDVEILEE